MGCGGSKADAKENKASGSGENKADDKKAAKDENKDFQQTMSFLTKVQLFMRLPKDEHPLLAMACESIEFKKGQHIIKQGESGSEFFVIKKGEASVTVSIDGAPPKKVATLKDGDYFGENALLRDEPRTATITAEQDVQALKITRDKFKELGLNDKLQFANRKAVGAGGGPKKLETKPPSPKTPDEVELIGAALRRNENLQTMVTLDDDRVKSMVEIAWKETVPKGTAIIQEGDLSADYFYVVQEGSFEILISEGGSSAGAAQSAEKALTKGESKFVSTVSKGGSFGELALLYLVPRAATVKATVESLVWVSIGRTSRASS
jgi:CRP-like cAMP-binding protein